MIDNEPTMGELMQEFEIEIPIDTPPEVKPLVDLSEESSEEQATREAAEAEALAAEEAAREAAEEEDETEEEKAARLAAEKPPTGEGGSFYKELALKYIEKGKWANDLSVEDADGNAVLIKDLKDIDEDTFFQLEEAIEADEAEDAKSKFISVETLDERKRKIVEIIAEGGELSEIFANKNQLNSYLNPFEGLDLTNEATQAKVYLNALINNNKLDADVAQAVVDKAKKDLTLDTKVNAFVEEYNKKFEAFVDGKKQELVAKKEEDRKKVAEFKKALNAEYKGFELKETLARRLTTLATTEKDGEFEIDAMYASKMEDPKEAAEIVLFLTDKETYLKYKLKEGVINTHKKVRRTIKLVPKEDTKNKNTQTNPGGEASEFEIKV